MWLWKIMIFFILSSDLSLCSLPPPIPALLQNNKILFWVACIPEAGINRKTFYFYDSSFSLAQNSDLFCSFRRAVGQSWDSNVLSLKWEYLVHLAWVVFWPGNMMIGSIIGALRTGEPVFALIGKDEKYSRNT